MKIRNGFVSNSSSSSFICISAGEEVIYTSNEDEPEFELDYTSLDIDELIKTLEKAKADGVTSIGITYGGGYDG